MTITSALNAAQSGLRVTGLRADVVATNVANATTPGYVRRSINIGELLVGGQTAGVVSNGIIRNQDDFQVAQRRNLSSDIGQANVLASTFEALSNRVGNGTDDNGLFGAFSEFETALSNAVAAPESAPQASALLNAANQLTNELNALSETATALRAEADREIAFGVSTVNAALERVQELNVQIAGSDRSTNEAAALVDERQRQLDTIAEFLPIQTVERSAGRVDVYTAEGVVLLAGEARQIEFNQQETFPPGLSIEDGTLSGLTVDGIEITPGAQAYGAISSGVFGGLFQLRDQDLPTFSSQLDTIAETLINRLSDDSIDPTKTPGEPGLFIAQPTPLGAGFAGRISVNPLVDPAQGGEIFRLRDGLGATASGPPGGNSILSSIFDAFTAVEGINENGLFGSFSVTELSAQFSSIVGQNRISQDAVLTATTQQFDAVVSAEQAESGVDIDAQLQDLLAVEQAYAANARVVQVASDLLNRLIEL
ncbi:MAG: flagellar hook-associated protein FlgK [Pseudomonadota bacterium]